MKLKARADTLTATLLSAFILTACNEMPSKEVIGAGTGAVVGGVIGSEVGDDSTAATIGGTILGAVVGGAIGRYMDNNDRRQVYSSLENNQPASWSNPNTDARYAFEPTGTYRTSEGRTCREYTSSVVIEGRRETTTGTACRRDDGTWEVVPS